MSHPQDNPVPVPFVSRLTEPLKPGQTLFVHGKILENASGFQINLLSGTPMIDEHLGGVALHINARISEGKFVFNSLLSGSWGKEERESLPYKAGDNFDIRIRVHEDKFEIMTEQKEIHEFKFRAQLDTIDYLNIDGDISLSGVHWGGRYFELPLTTNFPSGHIASGDRILVYATPKGNFAINLLGQNGDVLFHFNPRFSEKAVVRNSSLGGQWGNEEREGAFPFKKEIGTDIVIAIEPYSIQIFVDNKRYSTFAHRTANPDNDYKGVRIEGELDLTGLEFTHSQHSHQHPQPRN
jgi:hypothetical protein